MQLTKNGHSSVTLRAHDQALVLDPGVFSDAATVLDGATAVLITHEHPDHVDADALRAALTRDEALTVHAPAAVAAQFAQFGERVTAVEGGTSFEVAGFSVRTFGGQHAVIHPRIPVIANVGYLVDDTVFHPGDSFVVPEAPVRLLLVPATAPWAKVSEVVDYAIAVRPDRAVPIHEAVASPAGRGIVNGLLDGIGGGFGIDTTPLEVGTTVDVDRPA